MRKNRDRLVYIGVMLWELAEALESRNVEVSEGSFPVAVGMKGEFVRPDPETPPYQKVWFDYLETTAFCHAQEGGTLRFWRNPVYEGAVPIVFQCIPDTEALQPAIPCTRERIIDRLEKETGLSLGLDVLSRQAINRRLGRDKKIYSSIVVGGTNVVKAPVHLAKHMAANPGGYVSTASIIVMIAVLIGLTTT